MERPPKPEGRPRFAVKFFAEAGDYLSVLSRGRWVREFSGLTDSVAGTLEVFDVKALPTPGSGEALAAAAASHPVACVFPLDSGAAEEALRWIPPPVSTLREFEEQCRGRDWEVVSLESEPRDPPSKFTPGGGGSKMFIAAKGFKVLRVRESFGVREEILALLPASTRRLLDVGCGAGETAGEARKRHPGLRAAGIDCHPGLADAARRNLDAFYFGDALRVLEDLYGSGERFDAIILADFLEHVVDPYVILKAAMRIAKPGAIFIVSVPNASAIPVLQDLLLGRFDPIGAGPEDAGHLRWFTRRLLTEVLSAAGLREIRIQGVPVPSDGSRFLSGLRSSGISFAEEDLGAIQWLATAMVPAGSSRG